MAKDWLRTDRLGRLAQNERFCARVIDYTGILSLSPAQVSEVIRDLHWSSYYLRYELWLEREREIAEMRTRAQHDLHAEAVRPVVNLLPSPPSGFFQGERSLPLTPEPEKGIDSRFRALVRVMKCTGAYSNEIGAELDVLAPPSPVLDTTVAQPKLRVRALTGGAIRLTVRPMKFSSVLFQCRVAGSSSFLTIAKSTTGKLVWNAPGPFPRALEVRARFEEGDEPVGIPCPILPVTAAA